MILDHNRRPRNFGPLAAATHRANGHNPLCGDRLTLALDVKDGVIADVKFEGNGCAISKASASLMTDAIKGKTTDDATTLFQAASISKAVAAVGVMALVERGVLDLDTDVNALLRSWRLPASDHTADRPVTLRHLLSHTAGTTVPG